MTIQTNGDYLAAFTLQNPDGSPIALPAGTVIRSQFRRSPTSPVVEIEASTTDGTILINDAALGQFSYRLSWQAMRTLKAAQYWRDIVVTLPSGARRATPREQVDVIDGVTQ
jgi:hypothetical protein